jgi:hypothetical protein
MTYFSSLETMERFRTPILDDLMELPELAGPVDPMPDDLFWKPGEAWLPLPVDALHVPADRAGTTFVTPVELSQALLFSSRLPMGLCAALSFSENTAAVVRELKQRFLISEQQGGQDPIGDHASRVIWKTALHPDRTSQFNLEAALRDDEAVTGTSGFTRSADALLNIAEVARNNADRFAALSLVFYLITRTNDNLDRVVGHGETESSTYVF